MESNTSPTITKRLCHIVRLVCYMLRNCISMRKLMMDLQLLLKRGKLAGKFLSNFITHNHGGAASPAATGRSIEFSCSNTPFYTAIKKKNRRRRQVEYDNFDAAMIKKAFEMLNAEVSDMESVRSSAMPSPSPSPAAMWWLEKSPAVVRQLRVTDSPFMLNENEVVEEAKVDKEADDFIRRFYEHLRRQQLESARATPEYSQSRTRLPMIVGRVGSTGESSS
ncbi:hypothetical protein KFK09_004918 [Dendrobium nobile]|uniref:Uncharacterized protein n=1 Tax=Dendrobium nobile TaxID=94219 RepID=A0A8T3BXP7_DENNO|nr:hypothetical protein KFK09_004918 [Dendrobium nobile]